MSIETSENPNANLAEREPVPSGVNVYPLADHIREKLQELDLPPGYGLIGGAARSAALEMLTGENLPVRDIDIVAFTDYDPDESFATEVSERLMPDDYQFGHGVKFEGLDYYFTSRDFTANELAIVDGNLLITAQAEHDLKNNIIRPTILEHNPDEDWYLGPRLAVKAVLMQVVLENSTGRPATIEGVDMQDYRCDLTGEESEAWVRPFYVTLGFQKALEHNEDVAGAFLDRLQDYGMINAESLKYHSTEDQRLADFADEASQASDFKFRGVAIERLNVLRQLADANYSLGDLLHAVASEEYDRYLHYHQMAQDYSGKGQKYTDERYY